MMGDQEVRCDHFNVVSAYVSKVLGVPRDEVVIRRACTYEDKSTYHVVVPKGTLVTQEMKAEIIGKSYETPSHPKVTCSDVRTRR